MSEAINTGGPAFPLTDAGVMHRVGMAAVDAITDPAERDRAYIAATAQFAQGMTLRDHFAGLAMQAAAINPVGAEGFSFEQRAAWAYQQADAMIRAREGRAA